MGIISDRYKIINEDISAGATCKSVKCGTFKVVDRVKCNSVFKLLVEFEDSGNQYHTSYDQARRGLVRDSDIDMSLDFIEKSKDRFGDFLDYSEVKYKNYSTKVTLTCPKHGDFDITPVSHLHSPHACHKCYLEVWRDAQTSTAEEFTQKAREVHGDRYDYSLVEYKTARIKVKIVCKEHGEFSQVPDSHLKGRGCPVCGRIVRADCLRGNVEDFIARAKVTHNEMYDYSNVVYTTARTPVAIVCKETGNTFFQTPDNHLRGMSCSCCGQGGFDQTIPGVLYVLQADDWFKIGITNFTPEHRAKAINKSSPRKFSELTHYVLPGQVANATETLMLRWLKKNAKPVIEKFDGYTETFYDISAAAIVNKIEEMLNG